MDMEKFPKIEIRMRSGDIVFDSRDANLLKAIETHGSLNKAAKSLERSFSHSHRRISRLEDEFGKLADRKRGGKKGGGSTLTKTGKTILELFNQLKAESRNLSKAERNVLKGTVKEKGGKFGIIKTSIGEILGPIPNQIEKDENVNAIISSNAITLQKTEEAPNRNSTSARNKFNGVITDLKDDGEKIIVKINVSPETSPIKSYITKESLSRLQLSIDDDITIAFKAISVNLMKRAS